MLYFMSEMSEKFAFLSSIYLRAFLGFFFAFIIVIIAGKPFIKYLKRKKYGETIRTEGPQSHFSKKGTPTMGGVLIITAVLMANMLAGNLKNSYTLLMILVTVLFSGIGFIDDYKKFTVNKKGLSGKKKLLGQGIISLLVWIFISLADRGNIPQINYSVVNPFVNGSYFYLGAFGMLIFIGLVLMGSSNAVNITDGLDGLAIMPVVISALIFATLAYFTGHTVLSEHLNLYYINGVGELTVFLASICGAGLGFLWYNFYPAQIFMGDTGSLTLGGILGTVAILLRQELLLPIVGAVFVIETASVIIQVASFRGRGKRIFKMAPIHHHFELKGLPETKVTMRFWIVSIMCGILALGIIRMRGI